jgi:hypothetical protein
VKPREKVIAAFDFQETRPTPYTLWYDHESMPRLDRHFGGADVGSVYLKRLRDLAEAGGDPAAR